MVRALYEATLQPKLSMMYKPGPTDNKQEKMLNAVHALRQARIGFTQPQAYQIKIGGINFYPTTERITIDGCGTTPERGLDALLKLLDAATKSSQPENFSIIRDKYNRLRALFDESVSVKTPQPKDMKLPWD